MPRLTVEGQGTFDVSAGTRLVRALTDVVGIDQLHACGGVGKCTTCRVTFVAGEPDRMTEQERQTLTARDLIGTPGLRLSCQMTCETDITIRAESRLTGSGRKDAGNRPDDAIQPTPQWVPLERPAS